MSQTVSAAATSKMSQFLLPILTKVIFIFCYLLIKVLTTTTVQNSFMAKISQMKIYNVNLKIIIIGQQTNIRTVQHSTAPFSLRLL